MFVFICFPVIQLPECSQYLFLYIKLTVFKSIICSTLLLQYIHMVSDLINRISVHKIHSFSWSFSKYLLSIYRVPSTILSPRALAVNKKTKISAFMELTFQCDFFTSIYIPNVYLY